MRNGQKIAKNFIYEDIACAPLPLTTKLGAFIDKWNRHDGSIKYFHDGARLHVYGRIFNRVEKWRGREQWFENEQQELIDCFEHVGKEADIRQLADKAAWLAEQNHRVAGYSQAKDSLLCLETPEGMLRFPAFIDDEDATTFTLDIDIRDSIYNGYSEAVRRSLAFKREEVHSHHPEVYYYKKLMKMDCSFSRTWLYFVRYWGWIVRVAEERGTKLLLVGHSVRMQKDELLEPIGDLVACAKWVERAECEPVLPSHEHSGKFILGRSLSVHDASSY